MNWRSPAVRFSLLAVLIGALIAGFMTWREYERGERIQREIDALRSEAERIKRENDSLSQKILYFASPDFQEREAKEKLGFRRQEEEVVLVEGITSSGKNTVSENTLPSEEVADESLPNYRKWWNLFFGS